MLNLWRAHCKVLERLWTWQQKSVSCVWRKAKSFQIQNGRQIQHLLYCLLKFHLSQSCTLQYINKCIKPLDIKTRKHKHFQKSVETSLKLNIILLFIRPITWVEVCTPKFEPALVHFSEKPQINWAQHTTTKSNFVTYGTSI